MLWLFAAGVAIRGAERPLALTHVTLLPMTGSMALADMTVVIEGAKISRVGPSARVKLPADCRVIDARGQFLIPGLWDMHTHVLREGRPLDFFPLLIANGITGIRDMGAALDDPWAHTRDRVNSGAEVGPRIVASGPVLDGPRQASQLSLPVATQADARRAVERLRSLKVDFIKVYSLMPREAFLSVAQTATRLKIPFAGHVPYSVSIAEASRQGQKSVEHLGGYLLASSTDETEMRRQLIEEVEGPNAGRSLAARVASQIDRLLQTFSPVRADSLAALFARNGTWHCPTLTTLHAFAFADDPSLAADPNLDYLPASLRARWRPGGHLQAGHSPREFEDRKRIFARELDLTRRLIAARVPLLAGTDSPAPNAIPGFSLHEELEWLVRAGLSPQQALQAATIQPARYLGLQASSGTVERGKQADLVLLEKNPLDDIRNTRRVAAVVLRGKWLDQDALRKMLEDARRSAAGR